jgi:anti-sigma regulatory factor (Ser/Thr protein kinase)
LTSLSVAVDLAELERVRAWLGEVLVAGGVGRTDHIDIELAVTEALANTIRHTFETASGAIEIDVTVEQGVVRIVITDDGPAWDGHREDPAPDGSGGYGVQLIEDVMDVVSHRSLEPSGNRLTLEKRVAS